MRENSKRDINKLVIETNERSFIPEIIFIDLDGTLLDRISKKVSKKNIEAIKNIQKENIHIVISTGRSFNKKVKNLMKLLDVKYAICQNGAVVVDFKGNILKNITIDREKIELLLGIVAQKKLGFTINSEFLIYTNHWLWVTFTFLWRKKWKKIKKYRFNNNVNKVVVVGYLKRQKIWDLATLISNSIEGVSVKTSGRDRIVEVTHNDATKGKAAVFIANKLGINIKNTIHIGDSENDSTTLDKVGALIAMKDGSTKLLDLATHIGPKHKKGGVAKLLKGEFFKIER